MRLLSGRVRDPLVGRDVLVGCVMAAAGGALVYGSENLLERWLGQGLPRPDVPVHPAELLALSGVREALAAMFSVQVNLATHTLYLLMALLLFRFGVLSIVAAGFLTSLVGGFPLTGDLAAWHAYATWIVLAAALGLATYGFKVALGQRPAVGDLLAGP